MRVLLATLFARALGATAGVINFEVDAGAIADRDDNATCWKNRQVLIDTLSKLVPGETLFIPNRTYHLMGGVHVDHVKDVTIQIDGTLSYAKDIDHWPSNSQKKGSDGKPQVYECWYGKYWENVTFTSSGAGTMDGNGAVWWGIPGVGYLQRHENRPRLISLDQGRNLRFERIFMRNSPYWTFWLTNVDGLEVSHCSINAKRTDDDGHGIVDVTAFNTDGFDVTGKNVWIHDSIIWNQDDCIAVKDGSENMLFERIEASGLGLTIGSIKWGHVRNITFRDIRMHKTVKGIYLKFRGGATATIEDVVFENIVMDEPSQYAIWIGPAQQADSTNPCAAHPCSLCWPQVPLAECHAPTATYSGITLRNITVNSAKGSPGVIFANETTPMKNIVFEDVKFNNPGTSPFGSDYYYCKNVEGVARGSTWPVPKCFKDETNTCVADGRCQEAGRSCCSGRQHATAACGLSTGRCGCVGSGQCVVHESDCCSGKGHWTLKCGIGKRCDSSSTVSESEALQLTV